MSLSSRTSQQSSQEGSEPKFLNSYHTKPLLFGELNEKCKTFGVLDFEEDKKKAKENSDSEFLAKEYQHFRETLNNIQQLVVGTEKNTTVCQTVLEKIDSFASSMQSKLDSLQSDISQKFETLLNKVDSQKEMMTDLTGRMQKSGEAMTDLYSNLQSLKNDLECLREEQVTERNLVEHALKLISTMVSEKTAKPTSESMMEGASQTSPGLVQQCSMILQNNNLESAQLTCMLPNPECVKAVVPFQESSHIIGRRKCTLKYQRRRKKRQLVLSHRSKHTVTDENIPPLVNTVSPKNSLSPDSRKPPTGDMRTTSAGCVITPLSCWSQDSNSSTCLPGIEPMCLAESRKANAVKLEGLWQLFDMDSDSDLDF